MKKIVCTLIILALTLGTLSNVSAASKAINIYVNGAESHFDSLVIQGRTIVAIRAFDNLGISYQWNSKSKTAVLTKKGSTDVLKLTVGQKVAIKNDKKIPLDVSVSLINGRIMVPLRFIAEAFNVEVNYVKETNSAYISTPEYIAKIQTLKTANLVDARKTVLTLPRSYALGVKHLEQNEESGSLEVVYFPYGKAMEYLSIWADILTYVKVNDHGVAEAVWEGRGNLKEWSEASGKRPENSDQVHFYLNLMSEIGGYGVIKLNGEYIDFGTVSKADSLQDVIHEIPNETRID